MTPKKPIRVADNWCSFFRGQPAKNKIGSVDKTSEIGPQGHFCEKKYTDFFSRTEQKALSIHYSKMHLFASQTLL